jgi:hypothetical protein
MPALMICRLKKKTENLNKLFMKKDLVNEKEKSATEPIVIADECGDSMWDEVLQQEVKACDVRAVSKNAASLLNSIDAVSPKLSGNDTTEA